MPNKILPTVTIYKGKEKKIVNESDAAAWTKEGWSTEAPKEKGKKGKEK
jgi:hypothetical protein